jgi:hypothetical protein
MVMPETADLFKVQPVQYGTISTAMQAVAHAGPVSAANSLGLVWPAANTLIASRVWNGMGFQSTHWWWQNGNIVSGNVKLALYDDRGNLLDSIGSTAQSGTQTYQLVAKSAWIPRGWVVIAMVMDNTTGKVVGTGLSAGNADAVSTPAGSAGEQASAFSTLPDPLSLTFPASSFDGGVPICGMTQAVT